MHIYFLIQICKLQGVPSFFTICFIYTERESKNGETRVERATFDRRGVVVLPVASLGLAKPFEERMPESQIFLPHPVF